MTKLINELYYMVDDWASRQYEDTEEARDLLSRKSDLQKEIALRLGADGWDLLGALSDLNLSLSDLHDQALFRAAMQLGANIAQPGAVCGPQAVSVTNP